MDDQSRGLVALLFTDIEASTELWVSDHGAMVEATSLLDALVVETADAHSGRVIGARGEGDSHFVTFDRCSSAVLACAALLRAMNQTSWPLAVDPQVRVGLHVGEIDRSVETYYGAAISRAARLRSIAHGGQAVASSALVDIASDHLPDSLWFESLGLHRVRDWPGSTRVFQLRGDGLRHQFPPLRTEDLAVPELLAIVVVDIENSAGFAREASHSQLVSKHRSLLSDLRSLFDQHDGRYFQSLGDGCMAGFEAPAGGLAFAKRALEVLERSGLRARASVDFGAVDLLDAEITGHAVYIANELSNIGQPGSVVITDVVRQIAQIPTEDLTDLGEQQFRSVKTPTRLFQL